jgi:hypothetical protein
MSFFSKMEGRRVKQVLSGDWYQSEWGRYKEREKEVNIVEILCTHV